MGRGKGLDHQGAKGHGHLPGKPARPEDSDVEATELSWQAWSSESDRSELSLTGFLAIKS